MSKQTIHIRQSKYGKVFEAGKGIKQNIILINVFNHKEMDKVIMFINKYKNKGYKVFDYGGDSDSIILVVSRHKPTKEEERNYLLDKTGFKGEV